MNDKGLIVVIAAPSGTGKGTVIKAVQKLHDKFKYSVSVTTRKMRDGEVEGRDYIFTDVDTFKRMVENDEFTEWVEYCRNYYGTPKKQLQDCCDKGYDVFLDIEVEGAVNIKKRHPESVHIYMLPPSFEEIKKRIKGRGTETDASIIMRFERAVSELQYLSEFDYVFINDNVDLSVENILTIIRSEKMKENRNKNILKKIRSKEGVQL